ncbi:MAG: hypothetical protein VZR53_17450 [Prevotella sp.]|nr:hypothetical protein [Prevotella sp.]
MHELGAKLRIFSERRKEKGEKHDSWALQGKYSQMVINQTVTFCPGIKEVIFATLKVIVIQIKSLSLHSNINLELQ